MLRESYQVPRKISKFTAKDFGAPEGGVSFCYPNKPHWALRENMDVIWCKLGEIASMHKTNRGLKDVQGTFYTDPWGKDPIQ